MRQSPLDRESGSMLVLIMIFMLLLFALSAGLTMTAVVGSRANVESEVGMRAFYLADSGAQVGISRVRTSNGALSPVSFTETIAGGSAAVNITKPGADLYKVLSTGTFRNQQLTVETYVRFIGQFNLPAALTVMFGIGTEIEAANLPITLADTSKLSGKDYTASGTLSADQSKAVDGLAMNPIPGKKNFAVGGTGVLEGVPDPYTNKASYVGSSLKAVRDYAKNYAEVKITGSKSLGTADTGTYGTGASPKLIYINVGSSGFVNMSGNFTGYGTLVINSSEMLENTSLLSMSQFASWNGLILIYVSQQAQERGTLVRLSDQAKILGGFAMMFDDEGIQLGRDLLQQSNSSSILYSSELLATAPGTSVAATKSAEVISYRIP